ncbi:MAG: NAD(P)-binding protein [Oscillospiraceae bacterium]|nr:NAD(P)-binding protein [Oscillospiraceae bacterium]
MTELELKKQEKAQKCANELYKSLIKRAEFAPRGTCPVELAGAYIRMCLAQSCGKCVPCRIGLNVLYELSEKILDGKGSVDDLALMEETAKTIRDSADCAIGFEAASAFLEILAGFYDDYISHAQHGVCAAGFGSIPCTSLCPADVDVPGYIALVKAGRCADAVKLIRKDNPFVASCALVCEHPCESGCRRGIIDDAVNIRAIKRAAVEGAGKVPVRRCAEQTGKSVAVIGAGPAGLTCAYFLSLMGHKATVYEKRLKTGGMLRYGIPSYRLPDKWLDSDIETIISAGVEIKTGIEIGKNITLDELKSKNDAVYISIGAHTDKKLRIEGEDARGVMSAVELLRSVGEENAPDFTGKRVVVVGGGNVAMDASRTSMRLGANNVKCIYRRRITDMTALADEIDGAMAEGCEVIQLMSPVRVETDGEKVAALIVKPQISGEYDRGRPRPIESGEPERRIECDVIIVAVGQDVESEHFMESGIPTRWGLITANSKGTVVSRDGGIFSGGDCVTGPATVIRAVEAGKVASRNIDTYLGFSHKITCDVEIPEPDYHVKCACGRINTKERPESERKNDFNLMEDPMTQEEVLRECARCLRCDRFGLASLKGGRKPQW